MTAATFTRKLAAVALTVTVLLGIVLLSRVAWRSSAGDAAELRVSWRIPAPSNRRCRPPTEAELRGVLPHMRPTEVCTDEAVSFRLTILLDGDTLRAGPVGRSSARARTVSVHERFPIPPGRHALEVSFLPDPPTQSFDDSTTSPAANPDPSDSSGDPAMVLSTIVSADARDVILVTPDDGGRLAVVTPPTPN